MPPPPPAPPVGANATGGEAAASLLDVAWDASASYPMVKDMAAYGMLYAAAELSQQIVSKKLLHRGNGPGGRLDLGLIASFWFVGTFMTAVALHSWYTVLDYSLPGRDLVSVVAKMAADLAIMGPLSVFIFFAGIGGVYDGDVFGAIADFKNKVFSILKVQCIFWAPAQFANFLLVPFRWQVVYVGACQLVWANVLGHFKRKKK